jgi:transposase
MGRSRGGLTTKIHAVVDANGLPVRLAVTAGQVHDIRAAEPLLGNLKQKAILLADRAYDCTALRNFVRAQEAWANIPSKKNRKQSFAFSSFLYRERNLVERFFNKIKNFRAIATRYDKNPLNFLAALKLVSAILWVKSYESTA